MMEIKENFGYQKLLQKIAPKSHFIDIRVRMNGKFYWFEGDFLKNILKHFNFIQREDNDPPKIESLEQIGFDVVQAHKGVGDELEIVIRNDKDGLVYAGNITKQSYRKHT